jgi:predicted SAM-dependent methyltransferase
MKNAQAFTPIAASVMQADPKLKPCPCESGRPFDLCHGAFKVPDPVSPPPIAKSTELVRLDLGCGQRPKDGYEGVDNRAPDAKHKVDLFKFPWPWEDNSVDELHASHFVEHIPARPLEERDIKPYCNNFHLSYSERIAIAGDEVLKRFLDQPFFFAFFDECHRILKPGGVMHVIVPALQSVRAFQDPTHYQFIPAERFMYLNAEWRKMNGLDHYHVRCDFAGTTNHTCETNMNLLHPDAAQRRFREGWNTIYDFYADLVKK